MNILHVISSPRGRAAESHRLSRKIVDLLLEKYPAASVVDRMIGDGSLPHVDENYALSQHLAEDVSQEGTAAMSAQLIRELKAADIVVIGTPMHNFTAPSALKAWIDHVVRVRWTFNVSDHGKIPLLHDRPVFVAVSSGGRFSDDGTRQPDFLTPYLKAVFAIIGLRDLTFLSVQGTAFGPEALTAARDHADRELEEGLDHLSSPEYPATALHRPADTQVGSGH
jgi:FMN-dependent NADH-azoreductase